MGSSGDSTSFGCLYFLETVVSSLRKPFLTDLNDAVTDLLRDFGPKAVPEYALIGSEQIFGLWNEVRRNRVDYKHFRHFYLEMQRGGVLVRTVGGVVTLVPSKQKDVIAITMRPVR